MEATYTGYDFNESIERISEILDSSDESYEDKKLIPPRTGLTFTNGYYVPVSVLFVDMRDSQSLVKGHGKPVLAKIYRAYISEMVAVLKSNPSVSEIFIEGDGLWAIFNTALKSEIDDVVHTAARIQSLTRILNIKLSSKKYSNIKIGIGIDFDECLYIKAGYKHSGINEVVWIGKVVGVAASLCKSGSREYYDNPIMASESFVSNINSDEYKGFFKWHAPRNCYHASLFDREMNEWIEANE